MDSFQIVKLGTHIYKTTTQQSVTYVVGLCVIYIPTPYRVKIAEEDEVKPFDYHFFAHRSLFTYPLMKNNRNLSQLLSGGAIIFRESLHALGTSRFQK